MRYTQQEDGTIFREADGAYIPPDLLNRDYQEYLKWLARQNQ